MVPPVIRRVFLGAAFALVLAACGTTGSEAGVRTLEFVGRIPGVEPDGSAVVIDGVRTELPLLDGEIVGPRAQGNRLLIIGDSIMASTANRYGGEMCETLVPLGWRVAVEAESGRLVEFGRTVLRERLSQGWDAAVVFLGTNFGGDQGRYESDLTRIVDSLAPRPTVLLTATVFRDTMKLVNESIRAVAAKYPNVAVLDWSAASTQPGILNRDRIHPTATGRKVLVASVAAALGNAPTTPGACLPSRFTDDSLGNEEDLLGEDPAADEPIGSVTTTTTVMTNPASTTIPTSTSPTSSSTSSSTTSSTTTTTTVAGS